MEHNPLLNKDIFVLICSFLHWRYLSELRFLSKFHNNVINSNAGNLVMSICQKESKIKSGNNVINRHNDFIMTKIIKCNNCYHLDFSNLDNFSWHTLCNFDNQCHYLSLKGTHYKYKLISMIKNKVDITSSRITDSIPQQILDFMERNFNEDDIDIFYKYPVHGWFRIAFDYHTKYYYYSFENIKNREICEQESLDLSTEFNLETISEMPENSNIYKYFVEKIASDIKKIKKDIKKYEQLCQWLRFAKIDIVDLSNTNISYELVKYFIGCNKLILCGTPKLYASDLAMLRHNGVDLVWDKDFSEVINFPKQFLRTPRFDN